MLRVASSRGEREEVGSWVTLRPTKFCPPPCVWRHRRQTGLFVLDLGRGRSASADNRLKKVNMAFYLIVYMTMDYQTKAYNLWNPVKVIQWVLRAYFARCQCALRQGEHETSSQALRRFGHTRDVDFCLLNSVFWRYVHILGSLFPVSILVFRWFSWHLTLRTDRVHVSCTRLAT